MTDFEKTIDRLAVITVSGPQGDTLIRRLADQGFHFTIVDSTGGVVQLRTITLLVGIPQVQEEILVKLVNETCQPRTSYIPTYVPTHEGTHPFSVIEAQIGEATLAVLKVRQFWQL
jgi:uncharacterized protein YaaQ